MATPMLRQILVVFLNSILIWCFAAAAQQPGLKIVPLEGHNAVNNIPLRIAVAPVVEVQDENGRPVEGAIVVFRLPADGPGASLEGGQSTQTTITDYRGQAGAKGYAINDKPGRFSIEVTATHEGRQGRLIVQQANSLQALPSERLIEVKRSSWKKWLWLGMAAGAGSGAAIYFGTRNASSPISFSAGPVQIGGPR